jgi:hypothetical protein
LVTTDIDFAMDLGPYLFTGPPVMVLGVEGSKFVVTTRRYPALVAADAQRWWGEFLASDKHAPISGPDAGDLAPWLADECTLGDAASAWRAVEQLVSEGKFETDAHGWPNGTTYLHELRAALAHMGCAERPGRSGMYGALVVEDTAR